ncbi:MAG: hypothetical protein JST54_35850 [Deltaproteobacteria bacterium]|nr:hypothetical protein [Deltaproteobacteria bacterium]
MESTSGGYGDAPNCGGILAADGEVVQFKLTEYEDYASTATGNLVDFQFQLHVPAHFGPDEASCRSVVWGYTVLGGDDAGFSEFGTGGCDGEITDAGAWDSLECGGDFNLNSGFYDCNFGYLNDAAAMESEIDSVGFWMNDSAGARRYYDSNGASDFRALYFVVPR